MLKRLFAVLLAVVIIGASAVSAGALGEGDISAPAAVLMDADTGKILYEKNAHEQRACASITKVMTLTLVMEAVDSGKIHMDDVVTASAHAASANDAAVALAEFICGTEDDFVAAMNEKAKALGMDDTTFMNCNGLDEEGHITSAYDVALMSRELIKHEKIFDYTNIWLDNLRGGETQIVNTNKLLRSYDGITGLKTGTTGEAGACISATAERNGLSLIGVVLGADSGKERFRDAATLLDYGFANFESKELGLEEELAPITVEGGMEDEVSISCEGVTGLTVPKGEGEGITQTVDIPESLTAPVRKGDVVGRVVFTLNGEELASFDVTANDDVEEKSFGSILGLLLHSLIKM